MPAHPHPDRIARCVIEAFDALPNKYKPRTLSDGRREWVPLAGIVLSRKSDRGRYPATVSAEPSAINQSREEEQPNPNNSASSEEILTCAALATGMKCLPYSKLPIANGAVLHDSHAEILALRAFNRFLLDECLTLAQATSKTRERHTESSPWVRWRTQNDSQSVDSSASTYPRPPFQLRENIGIHMYCSELPCGDASMEQTMSEQADATPWATAAAATAPTSAVQPLVLGSEQATTIPPAPTSPQSSPPFINGNNRQQQQQQQQQPLLGRGHFDRLGIVRRKPSRPDAPLSFSKSCSDKLALKQCTGLLSGLLALLIHPARCYLDSLVVPEQGHAAAGTERAFGASGRMRPALSAKRSPQSPLPSAAAFAPRCFEVRTTRVAFAAAKRALPAGAARPSNLAAVCTPARREVLVNGVLLGRRPADPRAASCLSRRVLWRDALELAGAAGAVELAAALGGAETYGDVKALGLLRERESVKAMARMTALQGWTRNLGDEAWGLDDTG